MSKIQSSFARPVYIVAGARTPQLKMRVAPGAFSASDLALQTCRALLAKQPFAPDMLDEVVTGCMMPSENEANISRVIALRLGCGNAMPAYTVQRNCGSGLQAIDNAALEIASGRCDLVLAGGVEAMSRAPLLVNHQLTAWLAAFRAAKNLSAKAKMLTQLRPNYLMPISALLRGLTDPLVNLSMGQTAEKLAQQFHISREQMDAFALLSHQRAASAQDNGHFSAEITPLYDAAGKYYDADNGVRRDTTLEKLASLKPFFAKPFGLVTAGNSSQITDGAAFLILASADVVKKYQLPTLARIVDIVWKGLDPSAMGLGPVYAGAALLQQQRLTHGDIDYWEINEAFASQTLACLAAWEDADFCRQELGLKTAFGQLDRTRLNVDGGAIAVGHPVAASGARITLHLAQVLQRMNAKRGVASLCIGGGQGGAILIER
jgi:acetyl-CoA C-acetyltransferase